MSKPRMLAKNVQLHVGVPMLASKLSVQASKSNELEVTEFGVIARSSKTKRAILLPYSNIIGVELFYDSAQSSDESEE